MESLIKDRVELLIDYIMKNCLWQFHSRAWDRKRQNEGVLSIATRLLCGETVTPETPEQKCYWVDAVCLAEAYARRHPWLATMGQDQIKALMQALHERLDHLTITGSLNEELTDQQY